MCRIAAYHGPSIPLANIITRPKHSLLNQSLCANEGKQAVNADGFGISWYGNDAEPGLYREVLPAWADDNLTSLCRMVCAPLFIGHVRAATMGETSRQNCHPFTHDRWSFCHNGQIPHFRQVRRKIEAQLPDAFYEMRGGNTDSEMLFLTMLSFGLEHDPGEAITKSISAFGTGLKPVKMTIVFSDGRTLYGFRYASSGRAPTLYVSGVLDNGGRAFASEPLDGVSNTWELLPERTLWSLGAQGEMIMPVAA